MVLIVLSGIFIIASLSGIIADLSENPYHNAVNDLKYIESELSVKFLTISNSTVELAGKISASIKKQLREMDIELSDLKNHPELLEGLLASEVEKARFIMEKAGVTGVFVFIDATVNPQLERANESKAGFYIVDMNHDPVTYMNHQLFMLYGPVDLARKNIMHLHPQWELELDISPDTPKRRRDMFLKPFDAAISYKVDNIYHLGYWNPLFTPAENTDKVITYSVPLLDENGSPYGVCGLEISRTLLENMLPKKSSFKFEREVLLCSTRTIEGIDMENALVCGSNSSWLINGNSKILSVLPGSKENSLNEYNFSEHPKTKIVGLDMDVRLYPGKSVFRDDRWALALLIPKSDVTAKTARLTKAIVFLVLLLAISVIITFFSSKYCISPLMEAISKIKQNESQEKTNIIEIDDLIEFLQMRTDTAAADEQANIFGPAWHDKMSKREELSPDHDDLSPEQIKQFEEQLKTLTKAERRIFDLYIQGYDAKEICNMLYISINTIKTHNRRIYTKMNVSSRAELLKYCHKLMGKI
ncbi:MAG TPA: LuxR C-terminal-related transcriptional regulator [Clostridiales bacterium]|nr:LuxR C-terminal-related transcriptional regulator [Clostridiales bacterium]